MFSSLPDIYVYIKNNAAFHNTGKQYIPINRAAKRLMYSRKFKNRVKKNLDMIFMNNDFITTKEFLKEEINNQIQVDLGAKDES